MTPLIRSLEFDSNLFGYPVGAIQVEASGCTESMARETLQQDNNPFQVVYIFSKQPLDSFGEPADIKLVYLKSSLLPSSASQSMVSYTGGDDQRLHELAYASGVYSRFHTDPRFVRNEFQKLYTLWMEKSIRKEIADAILVHRDIKGITGMVTVAAQNAEAEIGLIAVSESERGKGIASALISQAESFAAEKGCRQLKVATQAANQPASLLYEKNGFTLFSKTYIYH